MKKLFLFSALLFLGGIAKAADEAQLPKDCFTTIDNTQFCSTDNIGKVQVYVFNAGWCGPCNEEMDEMPGVFQQFQDKPVVIASLSGQSYSSGEPDQKFLQDWKRKHSLPTHPNFVIAGKYNDFGDQFGAEGYVPFTVIVDKSGKIVDKGSLGGSEIESQVRRLLNEE